MVGDLGGGVIVLLVPHEDFHRTGVLALRTLLSGGL